MKFTFIAVPSVEITFFFNKTPCAKLHDVSFHKTTPSTKNGNDEYSDLPRCGSTVDWLRFEEKCK